MRYEVFERSEVYRIIMPLVTLSLQARWHEKAGTAQLQVASGRCHVLHLKMTFRRPPCLRVPGRPIPTRSNTGTGKAILSLTSEYGLS